HGPELLPVDQRFLQHLLDGAGNIAYQLAFNSLIRAVHADPDFSLGWLEHELERCDYRRPIARAIADRDPDGAATAARDALLPAAEMPGSGAQPPKDAWGQVKGGTGGYPPGTQRGSSAYARDR